jgi:hypothetical protein
METYFHNRNNSIRRGPRAVLGETEGVADTHNARQEHVFPKVLLHATPTRFFPKIQHWRETSMNSDGSRLRTQSTTDGVDEIWIESSSHAELLREYGAFPRSNAVQTLSSLK